MRLNLDNDAAQVLMERHTMQGRLVKDSGPCITTQKRLALNELAYRHMGTVSSTDADIMVLVQACPSTDTDAAGTK